MGRVAVNEGFNFEPFASAGVGEVFGISGVGALGTVAALVEPLGRTREP